MKKTVKIMLFVASASAIFWMLLLMMMSGVLGGGSNVPIPADEEMATDYQIIGSELNLDWTWIMLIDMMLANINGEPNLMNQNPVITALNCIQVEIEVYEFQDDNSSWEYSYTDYAYGASEILTYFDLPGDVKDIHLVIRTIKNKNSNRYKISMHRYGSLEEILDIYYSFDEEIREEILELYRSGYLIELYGDPYHTATGDGLDGIFDDFELGDIMLPEIGMQIPLYFQYQDPWGKLKFGGGNVTTSGCSITCIAMVYSYLQDETITPIDIMEWTGNRYYVGNAGQSWEIFPATAKQWGLSCNRLGTNMQLALSELSSGKPVIASMAPGMFTKNGHFIVLRGITEDGNILVNDPNDNASKGFFYKSFSPALISREAKQYWSFGN